MTHSIIDSLPTSIIETLPPPANTPEQWARYVELLSLERPTVGQQREFAELVAKLKLTANDCKLHKVIIAAAKKREDQVRDLDEKTLQDADFAANQADDDARQRMRDEIGQLLTRLQTNDFRECHTHTKARNAVSMFLHNRDELQGIYSRWHYLFGLPEPANKRKPSSTHPPDEIARAATELKINSVFAD